MEIYSIILINKYAHNKYCRIIYDNIFFTLVKFTQKIHVLRRIFFHVLSNT